MDFVFAGIPNQQLESLIKLLVAACAVTARGSTTQELKTLATSVVSGAKRAEQAMVVDVVGTLLRIIKGETVDEEDLSSRMKTLRQAVRDEIRSDRKFDHNTVDLLAATSAYLINYGEPALRKIRKLVNAMDEPVLQRALAPEAQSQKDFIRPLEKIVTKVSGKKGIILTKDQAEKLRAKNKEIFREYMRLRKQYNLVWKDEMNAYIVKSKQKAVPYKDVLNYLNSKKIDHPLQPGFDGLIDANGKTYTMAGKAINGGVPAKGSGFTIKMNPDYNPKLDDGYVFTTINEKNGEVSQHVYTVDFRKQKNSKKFEMVHQLMAVMEKIHNSWQTYLKRNDLSKPCVQATVLELLYQFSARVGTKGNATSVNGKNVSTFGIATLQARHFKVNGNVITIVYPGKDAVRQSHVIQGTGSQQAKYLVANIKKFLVGKQPKDPVFQYELPNGRMRPIIGGEVTGMLRRLGGPPNVTAHKLRHVKGTEIFMQLMEKNKAKLKPDTMNQAQADALFKQFVTEVGATLGHVRGVGKQQKVTGATAMKSYLDPGVMLSFWDQVGLRPPRGLEKIKNQSE
jgi:hypothetical protein